MISNNCHASLSTSSVKQVGFDFRINPAIIYEIKQHIDIVEVLLEHVRLKKNGKEYVGLCPFHDEKTPSFSVSPTKQVYHCFGCGAAGDVIKFLMQLGEHSFPDVVQDLGQRYGISVSNFQQSPTARLPYPQPKKSKLELGETRKDCTVDKVYVQRSHERLLHSGAVQEQALGWLTGTARNFTPQMIAHYRLGLESVRYKNEHSGQWENWWGIAIFIPVPSRPGRYYKKVRVAPWVVGDSRPDYIKDWYQKGVPATVWTIYNPEGATQTWYTEGEWDGMALAYLAHCQSEKVAIACSTSGCGTVPPVEQLNALTCPLFTFFDRNDGLNTLGVRPGDNGARKLVEVLAGRGVVALVPMPEDCEIKGWDVSDSLAHGYGMNDFRAAAGGSPGLMGISFTYLQKQRASVTEGYQS